MQSRWIAIIPGFVFALILTSRSVKAPACFRGMLNPGMEDQDLGSDPLPRCPVTRRGRTIKGVLLWLLLLLPGIALGQEYLKQFPLRQQTSYFDFRYKRNPEKIATIARFADAFVKTINTDFFKANFDYPIRVLVLEDREQFQNFLRREFHLSDPPGFGIYIPPPYKLFATYEDSGLGTFAHEIMHPLVDRNLPDRPVWAMEGIPGFFEKFYGYWKGDEMFVTWGYQNPWRLDALGTNLVQLDLKAILSNPDYQTRFNQSDLRMVVMFLWEQGKFHRFVRLVEAKEKNGYASYFEAAMEMPLDRVLPLWREYLDAVAEQRSRLMQLPASEIYTDESMFRRFRIIHGWRMPVAPSAGTNTSAGL
jgi:hypothetical protein